MICPSAIGVLCLAVLPLRAEMPTASIGLGASQTATHAQITPLMERQAKLLLENQFKIQPDGSVIDPATSRPVAQDQLPFLIQSLEGRKRLRVFLELDIILNKSQGEKHLTSEERESIRAILRENWPLFSLETRKNFRRYFSLEELESLDFVPLPQARIPEPELRDGETAPLPAAASAPIPSDVPPAVIPPAVVTPPTPPVAPAIQPAPIPVPPAAPPAVIPPTIVAPAPPPVAPVAQPAPIQAPPAAPPATIPPAVVAPPTPPLPAAPRTLPLRMVSAEEFARFLVDAPYNRDVKAMLRLIAAKASFARLRVINDIISAIPQIALDADRCGAQPYSRLAAESPETTIIALNPGVIAHQKRLLLFKGAATILPLSAKAPEGSQKILFSIEQEAGSLLAELMRLDARLRGWDTSSYAAETTALTAQWLFYDALAREAGNDGFLQGDMRTSYRLWRDQPAEYRDWLVNSLSAAQGEALNPGRMDPKAQAVLAEAVEAERRLRQERESHAAQD